MTHIPNFSRSNIKNIVTLTLELEKPNLELYQDIIEQNILEIPVKIDTKIQLTQTQINFIIIQFSKIILDAANKTIGKTNTTIKRKTVPWWNEECKDAIKKNIQIQLTLTPVCQKYGKKLNQYKG